MPEEQPEKSHLPAWAPRVPQEQVRRFYENDARGIYDEELIDELGFALRARCQSFVEANQAVGGQASCPACGTVILHKSQKEEILHCPGCGWELSWGEYFITIQHRQLSGAAPVIELFTDFIQRFPAVRTSQEKVLWIDRLIHGFHWYFKDNTPTRPVAINLIQGRLGEVIAFLDSLTFGDQTTPGLRENRAEWEKKVEKARGWGRVDPPAPSPGS